MSRKLAFIHTVSTAFSQFDALAKEILPNDVMVYHVTDEILAKVVLAQGGLSPFIYRRVTEHAVAAQEAGANVVQLTCSSVSPCADAASLMVDIPVLRIDDPMVDRALSIGTRIGLAATASTALNPLADLVRARAQVAGKDVQVDSVLSKGAYEALFSRGDPEEHDRILGETLRELMARSDVVLLAQASMARVADTIPPEEQIVPILSAVRSSVERARDVLDEVTS